ncbi:hypothetical protein GY12_08105 [Micrococcus luteus]|nr:hypothetical protein GY12_08105 [Micrococcus luteus]
MAERHEPSLRSTSSRVSPRCRAITTGVHSSTVSRGRSWRLPICGTATSQPLASGNSATRVRPCRVKAETVTARSRLGQDRAA